MEDEKKYVSTKTNSTGLYHYMENGAAVFTSVGAVFALVGMTALFAAGLMEMGLGVIAFFSHTQPAIESSEHAKLVEHVIQGVEILLLAPVPYLVFIAWAHYLLPGEDAKRNRIAHGKLVAVKAFLAGLLFALIATNAVGKTLESQLTYELAISSVLLMVVLGAFFLLVERIATLERDAD